MFTLTFTAGDPNTDNGNKNFHAARVLREVADDVENGGSNGLVRDVEGKVVGNWTLT